jgi:HSP20 family protein
MKRPTPFDEMFERMMSGFDGGMARSFDVDVAETDDAVVVTADLPGFDRDDIDVAVSGRTLTLRADRTHDADDHAGAEGGSYVRRERRHESTSRSVSLPVEVAAGEASASYRNGVLSVTLPKVEAGDDAHRIDVE